MESAGSDPALLASGGIELDVTGERATITLSRPQRLNAMTPATWLALAMVGETLPASVRVVVVRGAGRAFSAGLDQRAFSDAEIDGLPGIRELVRMPGRHADAVIASYQAGFSWLRHPARVTIAAVQGYAIGAGFQLALACDLRIVASDARFRMAEPMLGLVPDLGGTGPLVRAVGYARAVEICLTGRWVGAEEAVATGLAVRAVPNDALDATVDPLVSELLAVPAGAATETLALLLAAEEGRDPAQQLAAERAAQLRRLRALMSEQS